MNYGDIFWANLPDRGGHEQRGRRPVIIWQDTVNFVLPTVLIIPLTGSVSAVRFPGTVSIQPTPLNGLSNVSVALVFQLGACDATRLQTRIGQLDPSDLTSVQAVAKRIQNLP